MVKIKVCGITSKEDALRATELGAWALGFIFYKKSPRYVAPKTAKKIIALLPKDVVPIGVFVDAPVQEVRDIATLCGLKAIQFHGSETPDFCLLFKDFLTIKAIRVKAQADIGNAARYQTDFLLFDTFQKSSLGGTGKVFDWSLLQGSVIPKRKIILSGGLNPENIAQAVGLKGIYAFDVASGVEKRPGKKCKRLLKAFFDKINNLQ